MTSRIHSLLVSKEKFTCPTTYTYPVIIKQFFNVYLFLRERERDRAQAGEGQREREREGDTSEAGSRLQAVSTEPDAGLQLTNREIMT